MNFAIQCNEYLYHEPLFLLQYWRLSDWTTTVPTVIKWDVKHLIFKTCK